MSADSILAQIVARGFGGLLTNMMTSYMARENHRIKQSVRDLRDDLEPHMSATFEKCTEIKTILNDKQRSKTLEVYVDQSFKMDDANIDQYSMIEHIRSKKSIIIIGSGGGGKSMFMRYLWLSFFEKSDGYIPVLIELRNLNSYSHTNIDDFVFHSVTRTGGKTTQKEISEALDAGEIVVFLDGFDEINFERRDDIQDLILSFRGKYPKITLVVTSRPDERFIGWAEFDIAEVNPLEESSALNLILRADYDPDLINKFVQKFDELYSKYSDFLSNPLLAYMMLVSFSYNPDIPNRMFQFYEQAFEALYHRHDLTKGYKRKFHCDLDKIEFIRLTAFFCLKTYYDEEFEFSRTRALEIINDVRGIEKVSVEPEALLNDLVESVCLLKLEGLTYTFTHRSFQEYFAAYCIARVASRNIDKLFHNFSRRYGDSVLSMVADINEDLFREKFLLPNYKKYRKFFDRKTKVRIFESFAERVGAKFALADLQSCKIDKKKRKSKTPNVGRSLIGLVYEGEMELFYRTTRNIASSKRGLNRTRSNQDDQVFARYFVREIDESATSLKIYVEKGAIVFETNCLDGSVKILSNDKAKEITRAFKKSNMYEHIVNNAIAFLEFVQAEMKEYENVSEAFSELF